jgi:hypothetical protein
MNSADQISRSEGIERMRKFLSSASRLTVESQALKTNMLGDPSVRVIDVYVPAGHDGQGLPLLVDLVGFTGSGLSHTNWVGFHENLPERLGRLIREQRMPPVVVAFPDCFTRLGSNQYINSASVGALGGLPAARNAAGYRAALRMWRHRTPRRVRQELRRVWRAHARAAPLRHLGGRGLSFRRYGLRVVLFA